MEITTRPRSRGWRRLGVVLGSLALLLAVGLLLPAALGLGHQPLADDRFAGPHDRGALLYQEPVRGPGELRVGDVITFTAPAGPAAGTSVTRRVVVVDGPVAITRGASAGSTWRVRLSQDDLERVVFGVPLAGRPQLLVPWLSWPLVDVLLALAGALVLVASGRGPSRRQRPRTSGRQHGGPVLRPDAAAGPMAGRATSGV